MKSPRSCLGPLDRRYTQVRTRAPLGLSWVHDPHADEDDGQRPPTTNVPPMRWQSALNVACVRLHALPSYALQELGPSVDGTWGWEQLNRTSSAGAGAAELGDRSSPSSALAIEWRLAGSPQPSTGTAHASAASRASAGRGVVGVRSVRRAVMAQCREGRRRAVARTEPVTRR